MAHFDIARLDIATIFSAMALLPFLNFGKNLTIFIETLPRLRYRKTPVVFAATEKKTKPAAVVAPEAAREAGPLVLLQDAAWAWGVDPDQSAPVVSGVTCSLNAGELMVIAGPTGSGKSALLQGLLGEIDLIAGKQKRLSGCIVATVSQQPWIMSGTLRENIVWGEKTDSGAVMTTMRTSACHLRLLDKDIGQEVRTKIGECEQVEDKKLVWPRAFSPQVDIFLLGVLSSSIYTLSTSWCNLPCREQGKAVVPRPTLSTLCAPYANVIIHLNEDGTVAETVKNEVVADAMKTAKGNRGARG